MKNNNERKTISKGGKKKKDILYKGKKKVRFIADCPLKTIEQGGSVFGGKKH